MWAKQFINVLFLLLLSFVTANGQLAYQKSAEDIVILKDKVLAIQEIEKHGKELLTSPKTNDMFGYTRYDKYGETRVYYKSEGDHVKQVYLLYSSPTTPPQVMLDFLRGMTREEMKRAREEFGETPNNVMYLYGSMYYKGKARYEMINDYDKGEWVILVTLL